MNKIRKVVRFLTPVAAIVCLVFAVYEACNVNLFSAMIYMFLANMTMNEHRYSTLKERLDAQNIL